VLLFEMFVFAGAVKWVTVFGISIGIGLGFFSLVSTATGEKRARNGERLTPSRCASRVWIGTIRDVLKRDIHSSIRLLILRQTPALACAP
jgi:hypothetical protein